MPRGGGSLSMLIATALVMSACGSSAPPSSSPARGGSLAQPSARGGSLAQPSAPTPSPAASEHVAVLANEEWIAYQWLCAGRDAACIFLVRPDGTGAHELSHALGGEHPDWSPDGKRIAFIRTTPEGRTELWVTDADGTNSEMLVSCDVPCNEVGYPDWAPDRSAIYVAKDADATAEHPPTTFMVDRFDLASRETTNVLTRKGEPSAEQPRVSPDGTQLVYTRFRQSPTPGSAIFVAHVGGGGERQLTDWDLFGAYPDWSTANRIVFNTRDLGDFPDTTEAANLYSIAVDGSDQRQLTSFGTNDTRATQPRWTPDGSGIVFTRVDGRGEGGYGERRLAYIDAKGTGLRWLTSIPVVGTHPQLRPVVHP